MMTKLKRFIPAVDWLSRYDRSQFSNDLLASIIVTIMLIPQSLAYAMLAGLPPQMGLYASILPLVAYAVFGSSRTLAVGPVAVVSLMTATAVSQVATPGSPEYIAVAILLALLSGLFLIAMGLLRLGFLANLLSHPVISGFISASAILIAISQLKHILGLKVEGQVLSDIVPALLQGLGASSLPTLIIGALSIAFLFWVRSRLQALLLTLGMTPHWASMLVKAGPVAAVLVSIGAVAGLQLADEVRIVGAIP
ncbi:MAG: sodium-independent anion transporter, partial [Candidatus Competibacteraceae bacterium]|nr:sodium-independent anion transporter [Candidatus Competibacteraceae bacterium]